MKILALSLSVILHAAIFTGLLLWSEAPAVGPSTESVQFELRERSAAARARVATRLHRRAPAKAPARAEARHDAPALETSHAGVLPETILPETELTGPANRGPKVLFSPLPRMPERYADENLRTSVLIEFTIAPDRDPQARVVGSSGYLDLDRVALTSARRWKFEPATANHKPYVSTLRLKVNFIVD